MRLHFLNTGFTKFITDGTLVGFVHCVDTLVVSENGLPAGVLIENWRDIGE